MNIESYIREIKKRFCLISVSDEKELSQMIMEGTPEEKKFAEDFLVTSNLRLVVKIANEMRLKGTGCFEDMISDGNLGLIFAAKRYHAEGGAKFSTYAAVWIKTFIKKGIMNRDVVRLPTARKIECNKIRYFTNIFEAKNGRTPTEEELAEIMEVDVNVIKRAKKNDCPAVSLDKEVGEDTNLHNVLFSNSFSTEGEIEKREMIESVLFEIKKLTDEERTVLYLRYGLDGNAPKTLEEVSKVIGKSKERVRQIQRVAINKMRKNIL